MISKLTLKSLIPLLGIFISYSMVAQDNNCTVVDNEDKCVVFDASESVKEEGLKGRYLWDFGDGNTAEGVVVEHCYKGYGSYKAKLKVITTTEANTFSDEEIYEVELNKLVAIYEERREENKFYFDGSESFIDNEVEIKQYQWAFGDGTSAEGKAVFHEFNLPGEYEVLLTVNGISSTGESITVCGRKKVVIN